MKANNQQLEVHIQRIQRSLFGGVGVNFDPLGHVQYKQFMKHAC